VPREYPALELRWPTPPDSDHLERLLAAIDDDAPTALEERDDGLRVFFATSELRARAAATLTSADPNLTCSRVDVSDEDWAARSQASLGPVRVGHIIVAPREQRPGPEDDGVVFRIYITPSMGFGTGHHASTRLCLALLQRVSVAGARVLDVGTGSGVLAIAAWKLGAREVVAADYDPDALMSARENLERNDATGAIRLVQVDLARVPNDGDGALLPPFDLLLANLTGGMLIRHAMTIASRIAPGGRLVASGFQADEVHAVTDGFSRAGLSQVARLDEEDWVGAILTR
jgi:ribosomal protein L11 methyltransferase